MSYVLARYTLIVVVDMKPLIDTTSRLYRYRLVRELNATMDGFYAESATHKVRCNRARLRQDAIEVHSLSAFPTWFTPSVEYFEDAYGREIVATRKAA